MQTDIGSVCQLHLEFMQWADNTLLSSLSAVPGDRVNQDMGSSFKSLFDTLNHVYLAELVWFRRVEGQLNAKIADLPSPAGLNALAAAWPSLHRNWGDWSKSLTADDWQKTLALRNAKGEDVHMPPWQVVLHLVNHGSYHRGQLATMLRQSGIIPPATDLAAFYRNRA